MRREVWDVPSLRDLQGASSAWATIFPLRHVQGSGINPFRLGIASENKECISQSLLDSGHLVQPLDVGIQSGHIAPHIH